MKKCTICGRDNPSDAALCCYCGERLSTVKKCKGCGRDNPADAMLCCYCGERLSASANTSNSVRTNTNNIPFDEGWGDDVPVRNTPPKPRYEAIKKQPRAFDDDDSNEGKEEAAAAPASNNTAQRYQPSEDSLFQRISDNVKDEYESFGGKIACFILGALMLIPVTMILMAIIERILPDGSGLRSAWDSVDLFIKLFGIPLLAFPITLRVGGFGAAVLHYLNGIGKGLWIFGIVGYIALLALFIKIVSLIKGK